MRTLLRRCAAAAIVAVALVGVGAAPAFAHAVLNGTDPGIGAALDRSPTAVTLKYDEPVEASLGAIRLYDARGNRVETGAPEHPGGVGSEVRSSVSKLRDGAYVVTWRVISADSHPVRGGFTFTMGAASTTGQVKDLAARLLSEQGGSSVVGSVFAVTRVGVFAGLALLLGAAAFLVLVWPDGRVDARATRLIWIGWGVLLVATIVAFAVQGAYAAALPLRDALRPSLWSDVWSTRFGKVAMLRLVLLGIAFPLLRMLAPRRGRPLAEHPLPEWWPAGAGAVGVGLAFTPGLAGHASTTSPVPLSLLADAVHVGAMALWLGGLVVLGAALMPAADLDTLRRAVPRYSQLALGAVMAIVVSGAYQSWRQVGSIDALTSTDYGRLLLVKLGVFAVLVVAAAFSRDVVNQHYREPLEPELEPEPSSTGLGPAGGGATTMVLDERDLAFERLPLDDATASRRLRRSVAIEVALAVAVLAVTALLVNAAPARGVAEGPIITTIKTDSLWFDVNVVPGRFGPNDLHLSALTPAGGPKDTLSMQAQLANATRDIAPIDVPLRRLAPGHYISPGFRIPFAGDWKLTVKALVSETDEIVGTTNVTIR